MSEKHRKEIESLLNKSESGVNKRLQKLYKELAEETTQDIIKLAKEIEEMDKFSKKLQKERLEAIRSQMYTKANQLEGTQKENIYDFLRHDGHVAFNELFYDFEMTEKIPLSFTMLTDKQINVIINTPVANRKLSTRLKGNSTKMKQNLNRVLTRGFAKGLSTQKMAVQIAEIGGANYRRAMNIARTESGRVTSVARQQSQNHAKSLGLKLEKQWISTLDKSTRHTHQILDGKTIDIDAYFESNGHKALQPHMFGVAAEDCNCRCRTITIVDGMGPELRKDNETKEVIEYQNYQEWVADKQDDKSQMMYNKGNSDIEIINPVYGMTRPKKADYDNYEDLLEARKTFRENAAKRNEWLDVEAERFYNTRLQNAKSYEEIIKDIESLGFNTNDLNTLDPVALDSINRGIKEIKKMYPDFVKQLTKNNAHKFSISSTKENTGDVMWYNGAGVVVNIDKFGNKESTIQKIRELIKDNTEFSGGNYLARSDVFTHIITHEFGHAFEDYLIIDLDYGREKLWKNIISEFIPPDIAEPSLKDLPFVSEYASTLKVEWFAEMFGQSIVGEKNSDTEKFSKLIEKMLKESKK